MPTEIPASDRGADTKAKPPATIAINRNFFQFMFLPSSISNYTFDAKFRNLFGTYYSFGVSGDTNAVAQLRIRSPMERDGSLG